MILEVINEYLIHDLPKMVTKIINRFWMIKIELTLRSTPEYYKFIDGHRKM